MIGTSDQSCWLAEACKTTALEGLWIYGLTVLTIVLTVAAIATCVKVAWDSGSVFRVPVLRTVTVTLDLRSSLAVPPLCASYCSVCAEVSVPAAELLHLEAEHREDIDC